MRLKFKVGDKVSFDAKQGIMIGTVVALSFGWTPELYRVEFKGGDRMWITKQNLTLHITREQVVFT